MTDWYVLIRAARYLGVAPWDLMEQSIFWYHKALESENIDAEVAEARADQARAEAQVTS